MLEDRQFSYRILRGGEEFFIDFTNGRIYIIGRGKLDREINVIYFILVGVVDRGILFVIGQYRFKISF